MAEDQTPAAAAQPPAGGDARAVPQPAPSIRPATRAGSPQDDARARIAALRAETAELEAGLAGGNTVNVKVEPPHSELHYGGLSVYSDFTPVPAGRLPVLQAAAGRAGVTLTTEEG